MDQERSRIHADLSGLLDGTVFCDDVFLSLYASDASIYQINPLAVVRPQNNADIITCLKYAHEHKYSVHPRGSGSSVIGASLGKGIILDLSVHMRRTVLLENNLVRVQSGVVLANLNRVLARKKRHFGPDPATRSVTTIGGVLATNATGSHWVRYGCPRDKVIHLQVALADGTLIDLHSQKSAEFGRNSHGEYPITSQLKQLIERRRETINENRTKAPLDQAGYHLSDLEQNGQIDLTRLMVGSEGTLGIITEATLATDPKPEHRGVILFFFDKMQTAVQAIEEISSFSPSACDLMDRRLLSLARETEPKYRRVIPPNAEAMLLVEFDSDNVQSLSQNLNTVVNRIQKKKSLAFDYRSTTQANERDFFWRITRRVIPILYRLKGNRRALPFVEDIVVERNQLPRFIHEVHSILNQHEVTASIFSHTLQGHVDIRPFIDLANPQQLAKMKPLAREIFELAIECGGSISGSYGDGLSRTWFLRSQCGPLYDVYREVKKIFDPDFILNPGKIVNYPSSDLTDNLRTMGIDPALRTDKQTSKSENGSTATAVDDRKKTLPVLEPALNWSLDEIAQTARSCNGCGRCRTQGNLERMCPIFRLLPSEEASPRAKANLMRNLLSGSLDIENLSNENVKTISDLCVNCHQCRIECPAGVDIPKLVVETKAQYVSANGMRLSQWLLTRLDLLYGIGGRLPSLSNWAIRSTSLRWLMDRFLGIAIGRKLPRFSNKTFVRWAGRRQPNRTVRGEGRKVVYFVDAFANWNDTEIGQAVLHVLEHNGVEVFVPQQQKLSGMSLISEGLVDRARIAARKNVEILADAVRQGYHVVTSEPSANLALTHEYLSLVDDAEVKLVAENCSDVCAFLWGLHQNGNLKLDFKPVNATIGYHMPCHLRAVHPDGTTAKLLSLIPGISVETIEQGCSGMAGTFGLKRANYRRSLRAGIGLINALRSPDIIVGATDCSTCRIQMEHGTVKPTIHPIKFLALAYGLMPELSDLLNRRSGERVLS